MGNFVVLWITESIFKIVHRKKLHLKKGLVWALITLRCLGLLGVRMGYLFPVGGAECWGLVWILHSVADSVFVSQWRVSAWTENGRNWGNMVRLCSSLNPSFSLLSSFLFPYLLSSLRFSNALYLSLSFIYLMNLCFFNLVVARKIRRRFFQIICRTASLFLRMARRSRSTLPRLSTAATLLT